MSENTRTVPDQSSVNLVLSPCPSKRWVSAVVQVTFSSVTTCRACQSDQRPVKIRKTEIYRLTKTSPKYCSEVSTLSIPKSLLASRPHRVLSPAHQQFPFLFTFWYLWWTDSFKSCSLKSLSSSKPHLTVTFTLHLKAICSVYLKDCIYFSNKTGKNRHAYYQKKRMTHTASRGEPVSFQCNHKSTWTLETD